jgi:hypothetical protein
MGRVCGPGSAIGSSSSTGPPVLGPFGVGDMWALRYRRRQIDDARVATSTRAAIDSFISGESIVGTNVVVSYAGHFSHVPGEARAADDGGHIVGPTLRPFRWSQHAGKRQSE